MGDNIIQPRVSIIVPVYKTAQYLPQCVQSILEQSFRDFELLLVDDGSPDESGKLCDGYAQADVRVRVIHKENGGVSSARNQGISEATGEYIVFIDSDDYVKPDYLRDLLSAAEAPDTFVIADYQPFHDSGVEKETFPQAFTAELDEGTAEDFRTLVFGFLIFPPYCKLYRRRVIEENGLRYNTQIRTAEDFDFNMRYLAHMRRIRYIPSVQYCYRVGYKAYVPSNGGVLGQSEIKSVHIMAHGITALARRMGVYSRLQEEIDLWAANKHYFNRLEMLFRENREIGFRQRHQLYRQLISDETYRRAHRRGITHAPKTATRTIGRWFDWFPVWWLFYWFQHFRNRK